MKVFFPRNIPGGWLSMSVQIWPVQISIVQLMLLAVGVWLTLAVANAVMRATWGNKVLWFLVAIPIFLVTVIIAFFRYSEMGIVEFVAKQIRTHFLDVTKKYQMNYTRTDPVSVALAKARKTDHDVVISQKDLVLDGDKLDKLRVLSD